MTYAADNAIDFVAVAREIGVTQGKASRSGRSDGSELVPTEVRARLEREGDNFLKRPAINGATIDREGLTNNYGVEPIMYQASFPSQEQMKQYLFQGAAATALIVSVIVTAIAVS